MTTSSIIFYIIIIIIVNDLQARRHIHASMNRSYLQFYIFTKDLFKVQPTPWASPNTPFVRLVLFYFILPAGFILPFSNQNSLLFEIMKKQARETFTSEIYGSRENLNTMGRPNFKLLVLEKSAQDLDDESIRES